MSDYEFKSIDVWSRSDDRGASKKYLLKLKNGRIADLVDVSFDNAELSLGRRLDFKSLHLEQSLDEFKASLPANKFVTSAITEIDWKKAKINENKLNTREMMAHEKRHLRNPYQDMDERSAREFLMAINGYDAGFIPDPEATPESIQRRKDQERLAHYKQFLDKTGR